MKGKCGQCDGAITWSAGKSGKAFYYCTNCGFRGYSKLSYDELLTYNQRDEEKTHEIEKNNIEIFKAVRRT